MAINDYLIGGVPSDAQAASFTMNGMGNRAQPDVPNLPADEMKSVMDELSTKVLAPAHNGALLELDGIINGNDGLDSRLSTVEEILASPGSGRGDMLQSVYVNPDPEEEGEKVWWARRADDATMLGGYNASDYAKAVAIDGLQSQITQIKSNDGLQYTFNNVTLQNVCFDGFLTRVSGVQRIRFTIPMSRTFKSGTIVSIQSSGMTIYGNGLVLANDKTMEQLTGESSVNATYSAHMVNVAMDLTEDISETIRIPVAIYGNFVVVIARLAN